MPIPPSDAGYIAAAEKNSGRSEKVPTKMRRSENDFKKNTGEDVMRTQNTTKGIICTFPSPGSDMAVSLFLKARSANSPFRRIVCYSRGISDKEPTTIRRYGDDKKKHTQGCDVKTEHGESG